MPQSRVKPVKWTGLGPQAHRKRAQRAQQRQQESHQHIQTVCIAVDPGDDRWQCFDPVTKQLQYLADESNIGDAPIVSRQSSGDLLPGCDQTVYTYNIRLNDGGSRYLRIRSAALEAPPTASYGASLDELLECEVGKDSYMNEAVSVDTNHGDLYHASGEAPVWTTEHRAELVSTKPKTNKAEVALGGSSLYRIDLADGPAYFCLLEGYKTALYGRDVKNLRESKLLDEVQVYRDGGTTHVWSEHGSLGVPSPQDQAEGERPVWEVRHEIEQLDGLGRP